MKNLRKTGYVAMVSLIFLLCAGCKEEQKLYTATESSGKVWNDLTKDRSGFGWTAFETKDGRRLVLKGQFSYIEQ